MENLIDFSDPILRLVLPILLKDQTTGKNIIWATDPPPKVDCGPMDEITIEQLGRIKLMPRVQKLLSEQKKRTKGKAEVFTPLWVVKKMADHAEQELNKGDWERFVHERCLEITCGEAPFLTSRYDPTTGEPVAIPDRVGILDRKLRVIQENATHKFQWKALDVPLFCIGALDGLNVLAERTEDFQSGWCFVEVGHIKEFDVGDPATFNGKLLDGAGILVKFHRHILRMPV